MMQKVVLSFIILLSCGSVFALADLPSQEPKHDAPVGGQSVYLATGEFYQDVTDLTIPGRGFPFKFTRSYRSKSTYDGPLGYGWDFNYNARIQQVPNSYTGGYDAYYYDGTGRREHYIWTGTGFENPPACYNKLEYVTATNIYVLTERDGTVMTFGLSSLATHYSLLSITDRNGNTLTLTYTSGLLTQITDTLGRHIDFVYAGNRIDYMDDFSGRRVDFTYDGNGDLISVKAPVVSGESDRITQYTYSSSLSPDRLNHNLLTITDPEGQLYLTNSYNEVDQCYEQVYGDDTYTMEYDYTGQVTETDRNNNVKTYDLDFMGTATTSTISSYLTQYSHSTETERTSVTFPNGNSIHYTYDISNSDRKAQGNLLQVARLTTNNQQLTTNFTYETHYNQVKTTTDAMGRVTTFYFDYEETTLGDLNGDGLTNQANGNIVKIAYPTVTLPDSSQQTVVSKFQYNEYGQVTLAIDPEGIETEYVYSNGYLHQIIRDYAVSGHLNAITEFGYDSVGNITSIKDPRNNTTTFQVNPLNQVTETIPPSPFTSYNVKFYYDANDNLWKIETHNIDENNATGSPEWLTTQYTYDVLDNMETKIEDIQYGSVGTATTTYTRDNNENLTDVTQPEANVMHTTYDERNLVYQSYQGYGTSEQLLTTNYYDNNGNLDHTTIGDGGKGTISYQYDGFDRRTRTTDALGNYTTMEYDDNSNVTRIARYNASSVILSETKYLYDELNRMYRQTEEKFDTPGGTKTDVVTTFWYDKKGRRWKTVDDSNHATITEFDNLDRPFRITDALNNKVEYVYDLNGNPTQVTETEYPGPTTYITTNEYNVLNRVISTTNYSGTTEFKYDSRNNNKYVKDRESHVTTRDYDGMNRLREVFYELNINVKYGIDRNGRLVSQTDDKNNVTQFEYDAVNRRKTETYPNSSIKQYTFTQYGLLYQMTDNNGSIVTHSYDNALRLTGKTINRASGVEGTTSESFAYDDMNRMTEATNNDRAVTIGYDSLGNMLEETQSGKSVQSVYNDLSFRTSLTYPNSRQITFVPDDLQRIYQIKNASSQNIVQYTYAGPNRVTQRDYLNGTSLSISYDGAKRAINYNHSGSIGTFGYAFDKEDNKKYEKRSFGSKGDAFKYDAIYRLTGVKYGVLNSSLNPATPYEDYTGDSEETFDLDGAGNRNSVTKGSTVYYTSNTLNQYSQIGSSTLTYDSNGNLKDDGTQLYYYDYANRLTTVKRKTDSVTIATFKYDALGRRIQKTDNLSSITYNYYYDGARCIEERNVSDVMIAQYTFGNGIDEVLTMERGGQTYYYHENSLGSIYAATNSAGVVIERYTYDAYGKPSFYDGSGSPIGSSAIGNNILFTGRYYDAETGLYDYRARTYSAEMGRFLQRDPAQDDILFNLYAYVLNNPIAWSDPTGLYTRSLSDLEKGLIRRNVGEVLAKTHCNPDSKHLKALGNKIIGRLDTGNIRIDGSLKPGEAQADKTGNGTGLSPSLFHDHISALCGQLFHEEEHHAQSFIKKLIYALPSRFQMLFGVPRYETIIEDEPGRIELLVNGLSALGIKEETWIDESTKQQERDLDKKLRDDETKEIVQRKLLQQKPQAQKLPDGSKDYGSFIEQPSGRRLYK
jgi:RHS repeat-associated protein